MTQPDLFAGFSKDNQSPLPATLQKAIFLARLMQERATELQTASERRQQAELDRMLQTPSDKITLIQMTDQAFRSKAAQRTADQFIHILDVQGVPRFFNPLDRTLLKGFQSFGGYAPGVAVPLVKTHMQKETANVVLPAEEEVLREHLRARYAEGLRMNVNFLGEALLGEEEAEHRLKNYLEALQMSEIEVLSVKISTIYSQISPLAREQTMAILCERMEMLYRTASQQLYSRPDGTRVPKFVYLDMEEYRDMSLTSEAFMRTLDRKGMENIEAGIALQAYIPDSFLVQKKINQWARERVKKGGAPVTIRVVKGANMEMERVEASIRGWPQAPYKHKWETDANYKKMLLEGMQPENLQAVRLGIASHNLFDVALGLVLAVESGAGDKVQFEMLEGMANHQRRALLEKNPHLLLYAPACRKEHFLNAIGYLIRRLDENTGPQNFLRHAFRLKVGSPEWKSLEAGFVDAFQKVSTVSSEPRRTQKRQEETSRVVHDEVSWTQLTNAPDTDFSLPHHSEWAKSIVQKWEPIQGNRALEIPLVIAGRDRLENNHVRECLDPSRPGVVVGRYRQATEAEIEEAVICAAQDPDGWRKTTADERSHCLGLAAAELRLHRADLMGACLANAGKLLTESDPEVSEAIDFCEFYRSSARVFLEMPRIQAVGKGVAVVVSPWNFPLAIPCGGVAAALAAGNCVILKPASDSVMVAWEMCQCFWRAGISKRVLQFMPCAGGGPGRRLVGHPKVDVVILTGGTETALNMLRDRSDMCLFAETGGKNATIVTALSDREQAIKHILHSAFSHSGQKCSATSLLLLEDEIYDDPEFRRNLVDAVQSIQVGSAWNLKTKMGPLIRPPSGDLERGLKTLFAGESWAVVPHAQSENPSLYRPGVKWGVQPRSYTHTTEFFGPLLGVMRFNKLAEAVNLVNYTGYGLTSGLESLDDREQEVWIQSIRAGNLYINRPTTGAIVLRQPFGGMGKSCFGAGMKAGGPNYVAQFMKFSEKPAPPLRPLPRALPAGSSYGTSPATVEIHLRHLDALAEALRSPGKALCSDAELARIQQALHSFEENYCAEFAQAHDHFKLLGEDNYRRYLPLKSTHIRVHADDSAFEVIARVAASKIVGNRTVVSFPEPLRSGLIQWLDDVTEDWGGSIEFVEESDEELILSIENKQVDRLRFASPSRVPMKVRQAAAPANVHVADEPVVACGRIELLWYVQEQSLSIDYHRYGNLGARGQEMRAEPL